MRHKHGPEPLEISTRMLPVLVTAPDMVLAVGNYSHADVGPVDR